MTIFEEYQEYMDSDGLVHPVKHPERGRSQNGIRWSSEALVSMYPITHVELAWYKKATDACMVRFGLYNRSPARANELGSPDDMICMLSIFYKYYLTSEAQAMIINGQRSFRFKEMQIDPKSPYLRLIKTLQFFFGWVRLKYNFNNLDQDVITDHSWFGRFPQIVCLMHYAAEASPPFALELNPPVLSRVGTLINILLSAQSGKKSQDGWALSWFIIQVVQNRTWYFKLASRYWHKKLYQSWPGGVREVLQDYFKNPDYPTCKYFPSGPKNG